MRFTVVEMQNGVIAASFLFTPEEYGENARAEAEAKYHDLLSVAAKSAVVNHGCLLIYGPGEVLKKEFYPHTQGGEE